MIRVNKENGDINIEDQTFTKFLFFNAEKLLKLDVFCISVWFGKINNFSH